VRRYSESVAVPVTWPDHNSFPCDPDSVYHLIEDVCGDRISATIDDISRLKANGFESCRSCLLNRADDAGAGSRGGRAFKFERL